MRGLPHMSRTRGYIYSQRKLLNMMLVLGLVFIIGRPLYWYIISDSFILDIEPCSPCGCNCAKLDEAQTKALEEVTHAILPSCERDIDDSDERIYQQLQEELKNQEMKAEEADLLSRNVLLDGSKLAEQERKELMKCAGGMMTSEYARGKVENAHKLEKESSNLWEGRARALGWKDELQGEDIINNKNLES